MLRERGLQRGQKSLHGKKKTRVQGEIKEEEVMVSRLALLFLLFLSGSVFAQANFPAKPITTVVGFEPGGGTDTVARIVAKTLGDNLGQQVLVENRADAAGTIAVDYVAKNPPHDYPHLIPPFAPQPPTPPPSQTH